MKPVLHIITTICRGGAENQLAVLASEQIKSGRKVSIIYLKDEPELQETFVSLGAEVISKFANISIFKQVSGIKKYLMEKDVIVHAHLPRAELISALAVHKQRFIFSRHNAEAFFPGAPKWLSAALSRFVSLQANEGIAISSAVKDFLISTKEISPGYLFTVVHYGYQELEEKHRPRLTRSVLGIEERSFVVGTIARLVPQKDIPTLLNSFKIFNESSPNSTLVIIGDGPIKDEMKKLAITLGINERILWVGRTEDVDGYLSLMDTFILTSKYEGFGLVLLEALNMHLPIIAANNSAIPEVLGTDFTGLVKTGDAKAFAEKLKSLINIDVRLANISMGQKRLQLFKASKMNEEMGAVYKV